MWPILGAQVAAVGLGAPLLLRRRGAPRPSGVPLRWLLTAGILDMTANALYIMAVQRGDLSIIAPVASLYPVTTVLLAMSSTASGCAPCNSPAWGSPRPPSCSLRDVVAP